MMFRILLADSDPTLREIYVRFFQAGGFDAHVAADGVACLRKLQEVEPDALVLEWELPWGGGEGVLAWLRENDIAPPRTIVVTTRQPEVARSNHWIPDAIWLEKPFRMAALLRLVTVGSESLVGHGTASVPS